MSLDKAIEVSRYKLKLLNKMFELLHEKNYLFLECDVDQYCFGKNKDKVFKRHMKKALKEENYDLARGLICNEEQTIFLNFREDKFQQEKDKVKNRDYSLKKAS